MHGSYRRAFGPESVLELHKNIIIQHEDYLKQDDSDKKADALRYMAGYVVQYLHLVPQEKKFTFKETDRVLHNSAMNIAEFDPREGSIAFCNLAKYAENLLEQPWRKDFHVIKLTSGFYVHNISAQLQNAHEILIVMGYVNLDETTLKLLPNHQSNLKAVSRDCYVASQECLILSQIWQHVADQEPDYPLTIGEVFEYRKNHLGDTDTICNKLLYDIRARMHALKLQQQRDLQHLHHNQKIPPHPQQYGYPVNTHHQSTFSNSSHLSKNPNRFVPVDRLIDFDTDPQDASSTNPIDELDGLFPERERNSSNLQPPTPATSEQFKNLNLYQDDDHMYDPVYSGEGDLPPMIPNHHANHQQYPPSRKLSSQYVHQQKTINNGVGGINQPSPHHPQYFYNNQTSSRKSVPANIQPSSAYLQHHNNFNTNTTSNMYGGDRNSSVSPMIPKTVTSLFSKSNSMNSIANGRGPSSSSSSSSQQPLTRSKVKETDLDNPDLISMNPRDAIPAYLLNDSHNRRTRKSMPAVIPSQTNNQVYPDQYYPPGIVKPVAVYGNPTPPAPQPPPAPPSYYSGPRTRDRLHSDHSEDVLNEAYEYASEVGQLPKSQSQAQSSSSPYHHQATPIPPPGEGSSSSDRQSSSPPSSGSGGNSGRKQSAPGPVPPLKRPSRIDLRGGSIKYADSVSPELQTPRNGGYRDLGSGSGSSSGGDGGSPASSTNSSSLSRQYPRNEELNSLDTVYYDYLLKQGQTDEVLGVSSPRKDNHHRNVNEDTGNSGHHRRQGSTSRSASSSVASHSSHQSSHHHHRRSNQNNYEEGEEDNHIYDGRRVVPKKTQNNEGGTVRRRQTPSEGTIPSTSSGQNNFNLVGNNGDGGKPSYQEKQLTGHGQRGSKGRRNKLVAEESEYPVDEVNDESPEIPAPIKPPVEPWDCRFCTFKNLVEERICEVCAKSKDFFEDVEPVVASASGGGDAGAAGLGNNLREQHIVLPKMYSVPNTNVNGGGIKDGGGVGGGDVEEEERECPQCTLLNPVRARVCDACNFRLKPVESPRSLTEVDMEGYDNR